GALDPEPAAEYPAGPNAPLRLGPHRPRQRPPPPRPHTRRAHVSEIFNIYDTNEKNKVIKKLVASVLMRWRRGQAAVRRQQPASLVASTSICLWRRTNYRQFSLSVTLTIPPSRCEAFLPDRLDPKVANVRVRRGNHFEDAALLI